MTKNCFNILSPLLLTLALLIGSAVAGKKDRHLDIYWVDVEGGAATLIVTPEDESILIDTGNPGRRDPDRIVRVATRVANLTRIDHLIITHYHGDHFGGASQLSTMLPIGTVHDNGRFENMPNDPGKTYFNLKCDKREIIHPGDQIALKQSPDKGTAQVSLLCLGTRRQFISATADSPANANVCSAHRSKDRDGSDNANSVVSLLKFGDFRFFDAGDLTWNQEVKLVCPHNLVGQVDVYQVSHHGLESSNNPVVLRSLQPTVAIMNNGTTKGCGPEVFGNLKNTPSIQALYQVHKNLRPGGRINNAPDEFIANKEKDCQGHYIKLSVAPGGKSYTVSIPAHGHQKTYQVKTSE